jgi:flagellar biosynthesis/type III secretory pathway protein FliH
VPPFADDSRIQAHLAILGAITQARNESPRAAEAAIEAHRVIPALTEDEQKLYWDVILKALGEQARLELETFMQTKREYTSDFARKYFAEGKAEGIAEGERSALLAVLRARGFAVPADLMDRIQRCPDSLVLQTWVERAARCQTIEDVFEDS